MLTEPKVGAAYDAAPAWSPDGLRIAFTRLRSVDAEPEVWTIAPDGSDARRLAARAGDPAWSPDGQRIAVASLRDRNGTTCFHDCTPNAEIYVMDADGTNERRLTNTKTDEVGPEWSPDGTQIAFASARPVPEGNRELYAMRADGSCTTRLTNTSLSNEAPAWRPAEAYSAPLVCGGAVAGARTPLMETDLRPARRHRHFPLAWLGPSHGGLLLSAVDVGEFVTFIYDDCGLEASRCATREVQVQAWPICARHPLRYDHIRRYRRAGGALLAEHPFGVDVYAGPITVTLFGVPSLDRAVAVARRLRLLSGKGRALKPPRFGRHTLARARCPARGLSERG